jgi:hypothetical protein
MPTNGESLAEKVQSSYRKLSTVASELNFVSDDLGKSISDLDIALKNLNLGLTVWVPITRHRDEDDNFWSEDLGYAKVSGKWGISLQTQSGTLGDPDGPDIERWLFNDGPRALRLSAIGKIPELLEALSVEGEKTTKQVFAKLREAQEVAAIIKKAAEEPVKRIIVRGVSVKPNTLGGAMTQELKK